MNLSEKNVEIFWDKVKVGRLEDCWIYQGGSRNTSGHGRFRVGGKEYGAHRFALASTGVNVENLIVRHRCHVPLCVNPYHLHTGSTWDNIQDRVRADRSAKGEANGRVRLTEEIVIEMRSNSRPHYQYAKKYKVDPTTISLARRGVTWTYLNEQYPPITRTDTA